MIIPDFICVQTVPLTIVFDKNSTMILDFKYNKKDHVLLHDPHILFCFNAYFLPGKRNSKFQNIPNAIFLHFFIISLVINLG